MQSSILLLLALSVTPAECARGGGMMNPGAGGLGVGVGGAGLKQRPAGGWKELDAEALASAEVQAAGAQAAWAYAARGGASGGAATLSKFAAVRSARSQLVAGAHYKLRLAVVATECGAASAAAASPAALAACAAQPGAAEVDVAADFSVWAQPWKPEGERWPKVCWTADGETEETCIKGGA